MKRSELKAIIKECLVEILAEGMGGGLKGQISEAVQEARSRPVQQRQTPVRRPPAPPNPMMENIRQLAQGSNIMADIFAHTAVETLPTIMQAADPERQMQQMQEMLGGGGGNRGLFPSVPQEIEAPVNYYPEIQSSPGQMAIGSNPMWDALAFGESGNNRALKQMSAPKIPDHVLDRKVSG